MCLYYHTNTGRHRDARHKDFCRCIQVTFTDTVNHSKVVSAPCKVKQTTSSDVRPHFPTSQNPQQPTNITQTPLRKSSTPSTATKPKPNASTKSSTTASPRSARPTASRTAKPRTSSATSTPSATSASSRGSTGASGRALNRLRSRRLRLGWRRSNRGLLSTRA